MMQLVIVDGDSAIYWRPRRLRVSSSSSLDELSALLLDEQTPEARSNCATYEDVAARLFDAVIERRLASDVLVLTRVSSLARARVVHLALVAALHASVPGAWKLGVHFDARQVRVSLAAT